MKDIYEYYDNTRDLKVKYSINDKGQKDGVLVEFYEDGTLKNILTYKEGKLNGEYKEFSTRGKLIETGYYQNNIKEGNVIKFINDGMLEGYQKNGKMIGEAVFTCKYENNNLKTRIHVKEKLIEGEKEDFDIDGKLRSKISRSYDGKNITDTFETYGEKFIEKGKKVNFKLDGKYQKFLADTNILVEEKNYKNGQLEGEYKEYSTRGKLIEIGTYQNGLKHGQFKQYTYDGVLLGTYVAGKIKNENFSAKYNNGTLKAEYKIERFDFDLGKISKISGKNYDEQGKLIKETIRTYEENKIIDNFTKYEDGIIEKGTMINLQYEGNYKKFFEANNILFEEKNYKNNVLDGEYKKYSIEGNLEEKGQYVNGKQDGIWITYSSTNPEVVKDTFKYKNGILEEINNVNINSIKSTKEKIKPKEVQKEKQIRSRGRSKGQER